MYSGSLYMLHDSRYEYVLSVRNNIDLKLRTFHVFIHQHRVIYSPGKYGIHVLDSMFIIMGYGHILSAYDIARTQENRISQGVCSLYRFLDGSYSKSLRP